MRYCVQCGGELLKITDTKYQCTVCKRQQFNNPKGAVALVLFDNQDRAIITRRAHEPDKGKLDPIGGFIDYGENAESALFRELNEETGLNKSDIASPRYIYSGYQEYHWHGLVEPLVVLWYWADLVTEKPLTPLDDVSTFESFHNGEIPADELSSPRTINIFLKVFSARQASSSSN